MFHRPKDLVGSEGLKTRSFASLRTTTSPGPSPHSGRQPTRDRRCDYVILRSGETKNLTLPSICHPEGCSTARRIWLVLKASNPGPSLRSGRPPTRGRRHDYVILRSAATKNLVLTLKPFNTLEPGPSHPLRRTERYPSRCSGRQKQKRAPLGAPTMLIYLFLNSISSGAASRTAHGETDPAAHPSTSPSGSLYWYSVL